MGEETRAPQHDDGPPRDEGSDGAASARPVPPEGAAIEEAGRESFPASDPPATWSGPDIVPEPSGAAEDVRRRGRANDVPAPEREADLVAPEEPHAEGGPASP